MNSVTGSPLHQKHHNTTFTCRYTVHIFKAYNAYSKH